MNILVITHFFEKDGIMGSVRWTNFAHRLSKNNNVYVLTHSDNLNGQSFNIRKSNNINVIEIDNHSEYLKKSIARHKDDKSQEVMYEKPSKKSNIKKKIKNALRNVLQFKSMKESAKNNFKIVQKYFEQNGIVFDAVMSTSRPFINSYLGMNFSKKHHAKWILDQRDLPLSEEADSVEYKFYKREFQRLDKFVHRYTIVSKGMKDGLKELYGFSDKQYDKVYVLYNGYTQDDKMEKFESEKDKLSFVFTGDLYAGKRDLTILLDSISRLINEGKAEKNDFIINYAGGAIFSLVEQAKPFGLEEIINNNGKISHKEALKLQNSSDIMLLPTWNTNRDKGILTGKIYEYMLSEKPIICMTSGEIPMGEAHITINELNLGLAVEYVNYEEGINLLKDYLLMQLKNKKSGKELYFKPDTEGIKKFDHDNLVEELKKIVNI